MSYSLVDVAVCALPVVLFVSSVEVLDREQADPS